MTASRRANDAFLGEKQARSENSATIERGSQRSSAENNRQTDRLYHKPGMVRCNDAGVPGSYMQPSEGADSSRKANSGSFISGKGSTKAANQDGLPVQEQLTRTETGSSMAQELPIWRETIFVALLALAQLFTQAGLGNTIAVIHIIGPDLGMSSPGQLSWLIAGYSLTVGTFILFSGRLGDVYGYKSMYLCGLAWFSLWNLVAGVAVYQGQVLFVFARVLQGIGPALCLPNGLAILGSTYPPGRRKNLVFAIFGSTAPIGSILGSLFGSLFALAWWPWAYWAFAMILAAAAMVGYFAIPPCPHKFQHNPPGGLGATLKELDMAGTATGVIGLVLVNFAWNQAPVVGWQQPYVYSMLILGAFFLLAFALIERLYASSPLIPFDAFSADVSFVLGGVACGWGCFGIWYFYTWQCLLELRSVSPLLATAMFSPVAVSGACAAICTGLILHRLGPAVVMLCALVAFTAGILLQATAPVEQIYWAQTFVGMVVMPWGMDMSFPAGTLILSNSVRRRHQGMAASLVNTVLNYSISLGLGIAGTVEVHVNEGGRTPDEILRGFRGAFYTGIGLSGLGIVVCLAYLVKTQMPRRRSTGNVTIDGGAG